MEIVSSRPHFRPDERYADDGQCREDQSDDDDNYVPCCREKPK